MYHDYLCYILSHILYTQAQVNGSCRLIIQRILQLKIINVIITCLSSSLQYQTFTVELTHLSTGERKDKCIMTSATYFQGSRKAVYCLSYVNGLPVSINRARAACYLFTDDTKLLKSISSPIDTVSLQDDIIAVEAWCRKWNLSLNSSKCCAIRFTLGKCDNGTYILNNTPIKFTNLQRDLGLLIKSDLSWSDHYNYICSKAYRSLYLIHKTIPATSSTELKKRIYFTLTRSHLGYCSQMEASLTLGAHAPEGYGSCLAL